MWVKKLLFVLWLGTQCRLSLSALRPQHFTAGYNFPGIDWESEVGQFLFLDAGEQDLPADYYEASIDVSHIGYPFKLPSQKKSWASPSTIMSTKNWKQEKNPLKLDFEQMIELFQNFEQIVPHFPKGTTLQKWNLRRLLRFRAELEEFRSDRSEERLHDLNRKAFAYLTRSPNLSTVESQLWIETFALEMLKPHTMISESIVRYGLLNLQTKFSAHSEDASPRLEMYAAALSKVLADRWSSTHPIEQSNDLWVSAILNPGFGLSDPFKIYSRQKLRALQELFRYEPTLADCIDPFLSGDEKSQLERMQELTQMCQKSTAYMSAETKTAAFALLAFITDAGLGNFFSGGIRQEGWDFIVGVAQKRDASKHLNNQAIVFPHLFVLGAHVYPRQWKKRPEITGHNFAFPDAQ